ncbi:uncharacterized protein [Littorina saxatilis]|uniref:uncharacterized protein isoform X1 n=2 Tax=Littorina saxatilis TaxID=31220 RepID=UPI0038B4BD5D
MAYKMNYRDSMQFIDLYRQHRSLWDKSDEEYLNKVERTRQRESIGLVMGMTEVDVSKKICNLRTYYLRELLKRDKVLLTGRETLETYMPKWPYFFALDSFLHDVVRKREIGFNTSGGPFPEMHFVYADEQFSDTEGDPHDDLSQDLSMDSGSGGMGKEDVNNIVNNIVNNNHGGTDNIVNNSGEGDSDHHPAKRPKTEPVDNGEELPPGYCTGQQDSNPQGEGSGMAAAHREGGGGGGSSLPEQQGVSRSSPSGVYPVSLTSASSSPLPGRFGLVRVHDQYMYGPQNIAASLGMGGSGVRPAGSGSLLRASLGARESVGGGGGSTSVGGGGLGDSSGQSMSGGGGQGTTMRNTPSTSSSSGGGGAVSGTVSGSSYGNSASLPLGMRMVEEDDDWLFGRYIVSELKKVENFRDKQLAKMKIQQIVTYAQLGMGDSGSAPPTTTL